MKTKLLLMSILILFLVSSALPPAQIQGYVYPPSCPRYPLKDVEYFYNFVGHPLEIHTSDGHLFITEIVSKNNKAYFSTEIPMFSNEIFALFIIHNVIWGGTKLHPGDNLTVNLCGPMPLIALKKKHK